MSEYFAGAVLVLVGVLIGISTSARRSRGDQIFLERQVAAHLDSLERAAAARINSAELLRRRQKLEEANEQLMMWLHDLERTIDEVWAGCYGEPDFRQRAELIVGRWPFDTLRVPDALAPVAFYWSRQSMARLREFNRASVDFVNAARTALGGSGDDARKHSATTTVWEQRNVLIGLLDRVRDQVAADLGVVND